MDVYSQQVMYTPGIVERKSGTQMAALVLDVYSGRLRD